MSQDEKQKFRGIWIPNSLCLSKEFNWTEKILLIEINNLDKKNKCFASNKHFAEHLQISEGHVANIISSFRKKGIILDIPSNGKKRLITLNKNLKSILDDSSEKHEPELNKNLNNSSEKHEHNNTLIHNIKNNINKKGFAEKKSADHSSKNTSSKKATVKKITKHYELAEDMLCIVLKLYPDYNKSSFSESKGIEIVLQKWSKQFKRHLEKGQRDYKETIKVLKYVYSSKGNNFFHFSAKKIVDNYDELLVKTELATKNNSSKSFSNTQQEKLLNDPRPDITQKVVKQYKSFVGKDYRLTNKDHNKFIETTKILLEKLGPDPTEFCVDSLLSDLVMVLREHYTNKGGIVHPGSFCSEATWVKYMPQYFENIPQVKMYDYHEQATEEFDGIVAEEEHLTKDIERNLQKQSIQSDKPIGDTDNPELDYMLEI